VGPHNIEDIASIVGGKKEMAVGSWAEVKAGLPKQSANRFVNVVQILEGCSGAAATAS
jgi:hypothetical protein